MKKKIEEKIMEGYRECYRHSYPPADFDELLALDEPINFMAYYLPREKLHEIVDNMCKYQREYNRRIISFNMFLGATPTSVDFYFDLYKEKDGLYSKIATSKRIKWVSDKWYDHPKIGRKLLLESDASFDTGVITDVKNYDMFNPMVKEIYFSTTEGNFKILNLKA